jgi:hypothetical protein
MIVCTQCDRMSYYGISIHNRAVPVLGTHMIAPKVAFAGCKTMPRVPVDKRRCVKETAE